MEPLASSSAIRLWSRRTTTYSFNWGKLQLECRGGYRILETARRGGFGGMLDRMQAYCLLPHVNAGGRSHAKSPDAPNFIYLISLAFICGSAHIQQIRPALAQDSKSA